MPWMIRDSRNGKYSNGIINKSLSGNPLVGWAKRGKVWSDVKYLKEHILKYTQLSSTGQCPDAWEVLEIVESAKPINEWIDAEMVYKLLKKVNK
jgi:hypothetical protein